GGADLLAEALALGSEQRAEELHEIALVGGRLALAKQTPERLCDLTCGREAVLAPLLQAARYDRDEGFGDIGARVPRARGELLADPADRVRGRAAREETLAGERFVEHDAEREDV